MRTFLILALACSLPLVLVACGDDGEKAPTVTPPPVKAPETPAPAETEEPEAAPPEAGTQDKVAQLKALIQQKEQRLKQAGEELKKISPMDMMKDNARKLQDEIAKLTAEISDLKQQLAELGG